MIWRAISARPYNLGRIHTQISQESFRVADPGLAVLGDSVQEHRQQRAQVSRREADRLLRVRQGGH